MNIEDEINNIAKQMDIALDNNSSKQIIKLIDRLVQLKEETIIERLLFKIYYNLGTAYADLISISQKGYLDNEEYVRKSILYYRKGELLIEKATLSANDGTIQLLINLGNTYSCMNRFTEAIEVFKKAIDIAPNFSMANGNLGGMFIKIFSLFL